MPEVYVYVAEGRTPEQKKALMVDLTSAVMKNLGVRAASVVVQVIESPRAAKAKGGMPYDEIVAALASTPDLTVDDAIAAWRKDKGHTA
jgi:4-oxalocrotonate tautomerase